MGPKIIIATDEARLRLRKSHLTRSLERFVQRGMFRIQLGPFNSVDHHLSRIDRSGAALGRRRQPVIMLSRHQYELASAVARDLDRLALSLMLKLAELALEFQGACLDHDWDIPLSILELNNTYNTYSRQLSANPACHVDCARFLTRTARLARFPLHL